MIESFETNRLVVREHNMLDLDGLHRYLSDVEVFKYMPWVPSDIDGSKHFLDKVISAKNNENRDFFYLAVIEKESRNLIGGISLFIEKPYDKSAWLMYRFNRDSWGKGFATEASKAMIGFGFQKLKLHRICAKCDILNHASVRVLENSGMLKEGCLRQESWQKGRWRDSLLYAILAEEWNNET